MVPLKVTPRSIYLCSFISLEMFIKHLLYLSYRDTEVNQADSVSALGSSRNSCQAQSMRIHAVS